MTKGKHPKFRVTRGVDDQDWQAEASCQPERRGTADPYPFFGEDKEVESPREALLREEQAKAICQKCPVQLECLEFALTTNEPYGIWGGLNQVERKRLWHERRRQLRAASSI